VPVGSWGVIPQLTVADAPAYAMSAPRPALKVTPLVRVPLHLLVLRAVCFPCANLAVGAAATLASVFRAPLTASLLLFELTRGYDIVLPLLAAAGTGPLVVDFANRVQRESDDAQRDVRLANALAEDQLEGRVVGVVPDECDIDNRIVCEPEGTPLTGLPEQPDNGTQQAERR
jgi:hypothetical protein